LVVGVAVYCVGEVCPVLGDCCRDELSGCTIQFIQGYK
jgi:hypothetical protein